MADIVDGRPRVMRPVFEPANWFEEAQERERREAPPPPPAPPPLIIAKPDWFAERRRSERDAPPPAPPPPAFVIEPANWFEEAQERERRERAAAGPPREPDPAPREDTEPRPARPQAKSATPNLDQVLSWQREQVVADRGAA